MQNRVRTHVAALMLLVPAATAFVAAPAAAQPRATVAMSPQIESFEVRGGGNRFEPGRELRFRLEGTPNARAWVDIPNVVRRLELRETRRGVYEGTYTIRQRDQRREFERAEASLQDGNQRVVARVALRDEDDDRRGRGRDNAPPQISDVTPANGARVDDDGRVRIAARLSDNRRIDQDEVTLRINGRDVTREARIDRDEIEYRANLPRGRYNAELVVRDQRGNTARRTWSFDVVERHARANPPVVGVPVPLPPPAVVVPAQRVEIISHPVDGEWNIYNPTPIRGRTFPNATVNLVVDFLPEGGMGAQFRIAEQTVRADANGNFAFVPRPISNNLSMAGNFYQLKITATGGNQVAQAQQRLRHRN
jgi:hypothetical protein